MGWFDLATGWISNRVRHGTLSGSGRNTPQCVNTLLGIVVAGTCLALYLRTIAPGALGGDAGELQFVPSILGLTHPTGYPLQTLLGKLLLTTMPIGSVAYRMNLFSVLVSAAAVGLIYLTIQLSTGSKLAAFFAALLLGVSEIFWSQAIIADKYALNVFLLSLVLFTLVRWSRVPSNRNLSLCALCYGISLTHHRSMLVFLPLLLGYWVWRDPYLLSDWRYSGRIALLVALPLSLYLWLPIGANRGLPPGTWRPTSLQGWMAYLLDRGYLSVIQPYIGFGEKIADYGKSLLAQFTHYGVILGLAGIIQQVRTHNPLCVFLALGFIFQSTLAAGYQVPRHWVFSLPSFVIFTLWIGEGIAWVLLASETLVTQWRAIGYGIASIALASLVLFVAIPLWRNYPTFREMHLDGGPLDIWRQDLKNGYLAQRFVANSLPFVEPDSIIVADWEQATPLWYFQQVEGWRPDVTVVYPIERWPKALATGHPTYLARTLPGVGETHRLTCTGPLVKVTTTPDLQIPADINLLGVNLEGEIELVGFRFYQTDFSTGYVWPLTLYFRALRSLKADYSISLRIFDESGTQLWAEDRRDPVLGMYPTTRWAPGEVVADYYEVPFPRRIPAGRYRLGVIVYTAMDGGGWHNLNVVGSEVSVVYLPPIDVPAR
ncbi:MAG: DUF2723 domain-containing protein [Chloroflexi bacterium]|nr:DUF2723 domain-containing protein [Chloroflexota bacterium]